jgi:transcriptional regulator with XRE-family HTH domain
MATGSLEAPGVGARVRTVRKQLGFTRRRVAVNASFSRRELASFERGCLTVTPAKVRSVAGSLEVEIEAPAAPRRERRKASRARAELDQAFARVRGQIDDVARCEVLHAYRSALADAETSSWESRANEPDT